MREYKSRLEPLPKLKFDKNRSRVKLCPCGKDNKDGKFAPYTGFENKGYCHSCGETFLPELPHFEKWKMSHSTRYNNPKVQPQKNIDIISSSIFINVLKNGSNLYGQNHFIQWLGNTKRGECAFDIKTINQLIEIYFLGISKKYKGWILFPYIDIEGKVRDIKVMDYNPSTGKRIATKNGDSQNRCHFIGKVILQNPKANIELCYYGEHLLKGNNKLVRIFESEASATYAAPFFPESICLATGGKNGCKWSERSKCSILKGRKVILYPDIDAHDIWEQKAELLRSYGILVQVSQLIRYNALHFAKLNGIEYSELVKRKYDLRDILQHKKLNDFQMPETVDPPLSLDPSLHIEIPPETYHNTKKNNLQVGSLPAYVCEKGQLYIETPIGTTYSVYPSIEHYNNRLCLPKFIKKAEISIEKFKEVSINLESLKVT